MTAPLDAPAEKIRGAFWGAIIGDALASPMSGLGKGHIHSVFGEITGYTDPTPALKGKESNWKKPGLYTAPSQLALLFSLSAADSRRGDIDLISLVARAAQHGGNPGGIFRHPDALLLDMIGHCSDIAEGRESSRDARIDLLPPLGLFLHLAVRPRRGPSFLLDSLRLARFITADTHAIAASAMLAGILAELITLDDTEVPPELFIQKSRDVIAALRRESAAIFELKINPETLAGSGEHVANAIALLAKAGSAEEAEPLICEHARGLLKHNITRATVNHPLTLAPFALANVCFPGDGPGSVLYAAASGGGAAGTLASTVGTLAGALHGEDDIPESLKDGLVNKTRIGAYLNAIASGRTGADMMKEFLDSEAALTRKEREELQARLRHVKVKEKKPKPGRDRERELNRHVVESWTKLDRAKWRKQKKDDYSE